MSGQVAHARQSRPDLCPGFRVKRLNTLKLFPFRLAAATQILTYPRNALLNRLASDPPYSRGLPDIRRPETL